MQTLRRAVTYVRISALFSLNLSRLLHTVDAVYQHDTQHLETYCQASRFLRLGPLRSLFTHYYPVLVSSLAFRVRLLFQNWRGDRLNVQCGNTEVERDKHSTYYF